VFITPVDESIIIGIVSSEPLFSIGGNLFTIFGVWASTTGEWRRTEDFWDFWTMFFSPDVFGFDETLVDFTFVEGLGTIFITNINIEIEVFILHIITFRNDEISVIIVKIEHSKDIFGDHGTS
jgi:hypothetical protein